MENFLFRYRQLLVHLGRVERLLGIVLLVAISVSILLQVFFRYVLGDPLIWVMEFSTGCFIWGTFLCVSYALKTNRHIAITSFGGYLPLRIRALFRAAASLIIIILSLVMTASALHVIGVEGRSTTVSLPITVPKSWFFSVPVLVSAVLSLVTSIYLMLVETRTAVSGRSPEPIIAPPGD